MDWHQEPVKNNAVDLRIFALFYHVISTRVGIPKILKKLDSRLRGNDVKVFLHWLRQFKSTALPVKNRFIFLPGSRILYGSRIKAASGTA